jgi:hypothetical protein
VTGFRKKGKRKNNVQKASSFLKAIKQTLKGRHILTTGVSQLVQGIKEKREMKKGFT